VVRCVAGEKHVVVVVVDDDGSSIGVRSSDCHPASLSKPVFDQAKKHAACFIAFLLI
jgi:hypothetical protein